MVNSKILIVSGTPIRVIFQIRSQMQSIGIIVPGLNPVDLPSRGIKGAELLSNTLWWEEPKFLKLTEREWPCSDAIDTIDDSEEAQAEFVKDPPEMAFTLVTSGGVNDSLQISNVIDCSRFSNLRPLLTVTVYILRFIKHCRDQINGSVPGQRAMVE